MTIVEIELDDYLYNTIKEYFWNSHLDLDEDKMINYIFENIFLKIFINNYPEEINKIALNNTIKNEIKDKTNFGTLEISLNKEKLLKLKEKGYLDSSLKETFLIKLKSEYDKIQRLKSIGFSKF